MNAENKVDLGVDVPPNGVYVEVMLGSVNGDVVHRYMAIDCTIASAAEQAVLDYIQARQEFQIEPVFCMCYWADGAMFGPFPVEINLTASAMLLRGNADLVDDQSDSTEDES